ncbi:hypothetical protein DFH07DRAFT_560618 [Mycena maculata]|uniref:F-box domain-containing protein n=1 Tax=Mycena maculata TaxID=230809 RepID=A0AAD7N7L6_9AGAR|nr:hypothetical protein DFH07DRAFT_560618 [Mycena maculata]
MNQVGLYYLSTRPMSAQELEARIGKISAEIELQKEVLKKLELSKMLVQRQLNAVRDPVARLPLEISSEIFIQSLSLAHPELGSQNIPMLLLNVCNAWANIAISTPRLWAAIHIDFPRAESFKQGLETWLRRAGNCPLSISLSGTFDPGVGRIIWRHVHRLKHLEIDLEEDPEPDNGSTIEILAGTSPGLLPFLETLVIHGSTNPNGSWGYSGPQILELLRLAPNLVECMIDVDTVFDLPGTLEQLALPCLRRLTFGDFYADDDIFKWLALPNLQTLHLSMQDVQDNDLLEFLQRSSPPLQDLVMGRGCRHVLFNRLEESLHLVPTLTQLELVGPRDHLMEQLLSSLAESPSHILPNLCRLTFHYLDPPYISSSVGSPTFWATVLGALSVRHNQLTFFKFLHPVDWPFEPEAEVYAALRRLAVEGMEIYIGTEEQNVLSV